MKPYRAIIWASFLLLIGEGIILSGFEFAPIAPSDGAVLGDTTSYVLENAGTVQYPGSYYAPETIESVFVSEIVLEDKSEETSLPVETEAEDVVPMAGADDVSEEQRKVGYLVQVEDTPYEGEALRAPRAVEGAEAQVSRMEQLMQKNERLYRERLIKELDAVRKDLESFSDSI